MLNKKTIAACTLALFLAGSGIGLTYYLGESKQKISQHIAEENTETKVNNTTIELETKNVEEEVEDKVINQEAELRIAAVENSEENTLAKESESNKNEVKETEVKTVKRPSLSSASRGTSLTPKSPPAEPKPAPVAESVPKKSEAGSTINGWSQEDYYWLAKIIYAESRGEPYDGQVAVGAVILRRVHHPDFPNTVYGVIFDKWEGKYYQFSPVADGSINLEPDQTAYKAARDAMNGIDPSGGALYFYNPAKSTSKWIFSRPVLKTIGEHTFAL